MVKRRNTDWQSSNYCRNNHMSLVCSIMNKGLGWLGHAVGVGARDICTVRGISFNAWGSHSARGYWMVVLSLLIASWTLLVATAGFSVSSHVLAAEGRLGIGVGTACQCSRLPMHCWIIVGIHVHVRTWSEWRWKEILWVVVAILDVWASARRVIPPSIEARMVWNSIVVESTIATVYWIWEWFVGA